jgi:hypothetical protein
LILTPWLPTIRETSMSTALALTPSELAFYEDQGYLVLRGRFAEDVGVLQAEADRLLARTELISKSNMRCRWLPHHTRGEYLFECYDPVVDLSPLFQRYSRDPRVIEPLRSIYGSEPRLRHDQLIYKPPGCGGYSLHQDFMGWPGYPRTFLTTIIALDTINAENGCIRLYPGAHKQGYLSTLDDEYHDIPAEKLAGVEPVELNLEPGDLAMFGCFTPHASGFNRSAERWRRQLFFCYNADADGGDARVAHYNYYHDWKLKKYAAHGKTDVYFA